MRRALEAWGDQASPQNWILGAMALEPISRKISTTTDFSARMELAEALCALSPKLTEAQAKQVSSVVASSLARAANAEEAANWARALVTLSRRAGGHDEMLVAAVAYPVAAGPATDVLLDEIRKRHPTAPSKEAGTDTSLEWLASNTPWVLRPRFVLLRRSPLRRLASNVLPRTMNFLRAATLARQMAGGVQRSTRLRESEVCDPPGRDTDDSGRASGG